MLLSGARSRSRVKVGPAQQHWLSVNIFFSLQNHPTFHSEEQLVNLARGRECFVANCWSIYIISYYSFNALNSTLLASLRRVNESLPSLAFTRLAMTSWAVLPEISWLAAMISSNLMTSLVNNVQWESVLPENSWLAAMISSNMMTSLEKNVHASLKTIGLKQTILIKDKDV